MTYTQAQLKLFMQVCQMWKNDRDKKMPGSMDWDCFVPAPVENLDEGDACLVTGRYVFEVTPWRTSLRALLVRRKLLSRARRAPSFQDLILDATVVQRLEVGELEVLFFALRGS